MNASQLARQAYAPTTFSLNAGRETEAQILSRITARLKQADVLKEKDYPGFVAALHSNRRLWTLFATDVAGEDNALPPALRAQVFYLAEFTDLHTQRVLREKRSIAPLIEINTAVLRGLKAQAGG